MKSDDPCLILKSKDSEMEFCLSGFFAVFFFEYIEGLVCFSRYIAVLVIWFICFFGGLLGCGADWAGMVAKFSGSEGWLGGFLAVCFVLLLFCFNVFVFQGSIWLYVGLASLICCCVVFFGWFTRINYRVHRKYLNHVSLDKERNIREETARAAS